MTAPAYTFCPQCHELIANVIWDIHVPACNPSQGELFT